MPQLSEATVKDRIKSRVQFRSNRLTGTDRNFDGERHLSGPARALFIAEMNYKTMVYVVYSEDVPLMWHGAFQWVMTPRKFVDPSNWDDYLFLLEVMYELEYENDDYPYSA